MPPSPLKCQTAGKKTIGETQMKEDIPCWRNQWTQTHVYEKRDLVLHVLQLPPKPPPITLCECCGIKQNRLCVYGYVIDVYRAKTFSSYMFRFMYDKRL